MYHDRSQDQRNRTIHNNLLEATMKRLNVLMAAMAALIFILLGNTALAQDFDITQNFNYKLLQSARTQADRTRYMMGALRACGSGYVDTADPKMADCKAKVKALYESLGPAKRGRPSGRRSSTSAPKGTVPCPARQKYVENRTDECNCPQGHIPGETELKGVKTPICIKCSIETPLVEKGECKACPKDKPAWDGSECVACAANELWVKEEGKPGNCVACEDPTPYAQKKPDHTGSCKSCYAVDSSKPQWDSESLSCVPCPDGENWLKPTPQCVACVPGLTVWDKEKRMCVAIEMVACGKTSIKVPKGENCPRWDPIKFRWDKKLKDDGKCRKVFGDYGTGNPDQPFGCTEERFRKILKEQGWMTLLVPSDYSPPSKLEVTLGKMWWVMLLVIVILVIVIIILVIRLRSNRYDSDDGFPTLYPPPGSPIGGIDSDTAQSPEQVAHDFFTAGDMIGQEDSYPTETFAPEGQSLLDDESEDDDPDDPSGTSLDKSLEDLKRIAQEKTGEHESASADQEKPSPEDEPPPDVPPPASPPPEDPPPYESEEVELLTDRKPPTPSRVVTPFPSPASPLPEEPSPQEVTRVGGFDAPGSVPTALGHASPTPIPAEEPPADDGFEQFNDSGEEPDFDEENLEAAPPPSLEEEGEGDDTLELEAEDLDPLTPAPPSAPPPTPPTPAPLMTGDEASERLRTLSSALADNPRASRHTNMGTGFPSEQRATAPQMPSARQGFAGSLDPDDIVTEPETPDGRLTSPHDRVMSPLTSALEDVADSGELPPKPGVRSSGKEDMVQGNFSSPPLSNGSIPPEAGGVQFTETFSGDVTKLGLGVEQFDSPAEGSHEPVEQSDEPDEGSPDDQTPGGLFAPYRRKK